MTSHGLPPFSRTYLRAWSSSAGLGAI
jgi:hypothetical protein